MNNLIFYSNYPIILAENLNLSNPIYINFYDIHMSNIEMHLIFRSSSFLSFLRAETSYNFTKCSYQNVTAPANKTQISSTFLFLSSNHDVYFRFIVIEHCFFQGFFFINNHNQLYFLLF